MARMREIRAIHEFPGWMQALDGFDLLEEQTEAARTAALWRLELTLPHDIGEIAEQVDPLITLAMLVSGIGQIEEKIGEIVQYCRGQGRSWTQIGEALGMTKQAAWERFSAE